MNSKNFSINNKFQELNSELGVEFFVLSVCIFDSAMINAFCYVTPTTSILKERWREISDNLNYEYLSKYEPSEFERWNNYLVFICQDAIPDNIKYEIENDKFYMRKVALELKGLEKTDIEKETKKILDEKLLLSNIRLSNNVVFDRSWEQFLGDHSKSILLAGLSGGRDGKSKSMRENWINKLLSDE
ncbi:hypothetical protein GPY51_21635 [Photorhabdus laumondii subsp. laumondii]|uniref:Photorhabdus luminescens subsp. laumondii TTO1 complete genome segment 15/17 n=2 Tax=Photorhabdus laumondii subsp. laumondii TaxID=141679 RepID=Q7MZE7_PHOLL|nr:MULTISPECIES: ABC-three component system middle component 1 [Photorhabdus]AWK43898.1 hypothetical protein A4R40_21530 [Photorhabdus laumondii subsp. laumondii]AXG44571.1 hypothetical protein PluDJC_21490 [Photorhabdus laumondii subsp. laumondii]AXG49206.1 hypothetical protein PluTT01m_22195 [Photorhabdus laumondii subsp. laumondii]KTL59935.1 hypothetical protein AA106_15130 [Photorhabdus laumondii subsp. laumondii]MCC8386562.1 hypothetical protein [Photorhabdus laumondii]